MQTRPCRWLIVVMFLILSTGCESITRLPTSTTVPRPLNSPSALPSASIAAPTKQPTPTPTNIIFAWYRENCLSVENYLPTDFLSDGEIILAGILDNSQWRGPFTLSTLSPVDNTLRLLPNGEFYYLPVVSPDGSLLAYKFEQTNAQGQAQMFLAVRTWDGLQRRNIPWGSDWYRLNGWLDNENVAISLDTLTKVVALNTATDKIIEFDFSAAELYVVMATITVDPQLTRVVYQHDDVEHFTKLVLVDAKSKEELWHRDIGDNRWITPDWTPDGMRFAVGIPSNMPDGFMEVYIVNRDGSEQKVTHFEKIGLKAEILQTRWSPNQRYIAFWLGNLLAVFDTTTNITTNYCIHSRDSIGDAMYWSADSQQLVFNYNKSQTDFDPGRVVVVDIQKNKAIEISQTSIVVGWR